MKEIVILSGSGGTGKTSLVAALAAIAPGKVLADCSVDAAGLHFLLKPVIQEKHDFHGQKAAFIDEEKCSQCGLCEDVCRFGAIKDVINHCRIAVLACAGCQLCSQICPEEAITMQESLSGNLFSSTTDFGPLVHAELAITQEDTGKLASLVRLRAKQIAEKEGFDWVISDGPAGIGSPAIASLQKADLALVVTEPTLPGIAGLERIIGLCRRFKIPALVCINKDGLDEDNTRRIKAYCRRQRIGLTPVIPYDDAFTEATAQGAPVVGYRQNIAKRIKALWESVSGHLANGEPA